MFRRMRVFALVIVALAAGSLLLAQDNPFVGTWKLSLAKSKFDPGPPLRSRIVTIEAIGENAVRWSIDEVDADGNHRTVVEMPKFDGKDYPRTASRTNAPDTIALKRIDAYTLEETLKKTMNIPVFHDDQHGTANGRANDRHQCTGSGRT